MATGVRWHDSALDRVQLALDRRLAEKALKIEIKAKAKVPVDMGLLQSSGSTRRRGFQRFRIQFDKEYAAYQERGMRKDGTRVVRNYTTPGTGKGYLARAANEVVRENFGKVL